MQILKLLVQSKFNSVLVIIVVLVALVIVLLVGVAVDLVVVEFDSTQRVLDVGTSC